MDSKTSTLGECLSATGLRSLPEPLKDGEKKIWIEAIVLVSKGGLEEYCLATNNGLGIPSISRDFGACRAISRIISVHPIEQFDGKNIIPTFKDDNAILIYLTKNAYPVAVIENLLKTDGKTEQEIKTDREIINKYVVDLAMRNAKANLSEEKRVKWIREFAENSKATKTPKTNGRRKAKV